MEGDRREKHQCKRDLLVFCISYAPKWRPDLQPRHVLWLGIEPAILRFPALNPLSYTRQGSFSFWICLWWCQMVILCGLRQPVGDYHKSSLGLTPSVINVVTQQSGLSSTGRGRIPPRVRVIVSPQAVATQRGGVCLSSMVAAIWGMTQLWDPSGCSLSSLPKACVSSLSSNTSSLLFSAPPHNI